MKPYIIVPIEWIEKEIALYGERITEFNDIAYYNSKIMLLYKMLEDFAILNNHYETRRESDSAELHPIRTTNRKPRHSRTRAKGKQSSKRRTNVRQAMQAKRSE